jgi:hypothetical protein
MGQIADLDSGAGLFAAVASPVLREFKAVGKKEEGNAAVSDSSLLGSPRSPKILISHLTLEFASGQIVLRMNARSPSLPINIRIAPGLA